MEGIAFPFILEGFIIQGDGDDLHGLLEVYLQLVTCLDGFQPYVVNALYKFFFVVGSDMNVVVKDVPPGAFGVDGASQGVGVCKFLFFTGG